MSIATNHDRYVKARRALNAYIETSGDDESDVTDLLADLMHFCDEQVIDFNRALQNAQWNYREEVKEEEK